MRKKTLNTFLYVRLEFMYFLSQTTVTSTMPPYTYIICKIDIYIRIFFEILIKKYFLIIKNILSYNFNFSIILNP